MARKRRLVLWDIDHTLIETRGLGSTIFRDAFEQVTGRHMERQAEVSGRTEPEIFRDTLALHGIEPSSRLFEQFADALAEGYRANAALLRERGRALPGAAEALSALAALPDVIQTVLTGNIRPVATIKLTVFDLDAAIDFDIGAYGSDDPVRANLVAVAQRRATAKYEATFDRTTTVLIGDTPSDVETARKGNASIIAIASGQSSPEHLRQAGAETVLSDLSDTVAVMNAVILREAQQ